MVGLAAGDHPVGDPDEAVADGNVDLGAGHVPELQGPGQEPKVVVAPHQGVGDPEDGLPQAAVPLGDEGPVAAVDGAALVARGVEAGTAGDCASCWCRR